MTKQRAYRGFCMALLLALVVGVTGCYPVSPDPGPAVAGGSGIPRTDETWINAKKLTVQNDADFYTDVMIDGDADAVQLTVQGHSTQTSNLFVAENSSGTDKFTIDSSGNTVVAGTLGVTGAQTFTGALAANGGLSVDSPAFTVADISGNTQIAGTLGVTGTVSTGADGTGADVYLYSDTAGDYFFYDQSDEVLNIIGTNAATALNVSDGNVVVNDDLTVTAGAFDVTAGATSLEATTFGVDGTGADVQFFSDTAGDWMLWDTSDEVLNIIGTNAATALNVSDGNVVVNDDLTVTTGATTLGGTLGVTGAVTAASDVTVSADATGGNAGAVNQFIGVPSIDLVGIGTMANGTTNTVLTDIGDSETPAADWTGVTAGTSVTVSNDSTIYRQGTASLQVDFGTDAVAGEGITNTLATGDQDWTDDEAFGFWIYPTTALDAGDLVLWIADVTAPATYSEVNVPAATANSWQWVELDVTLSNNNLKDVITSVAILLSSAGETQAAGGAFTVYFDFFVKWDVAEEEALGHPILQDGVRSVVVIDATDAGATTATLALYTDYFVHYQSGNDAVVMITDQSDTDRVGLALVAY